MKQSIWAQKRKQGRSYDTDNIELEQVDSLKYIGSVVNNDNAIK
jgi:hypothetical protein